jgi:signal peptidase II
MGRSSRKSTLFWGIVAGIIAADIVTKRLAVAGLVPRFVPRPVFGDWLQLRLVFNQGAAFGFSLGPWSRGIFMLLTVVAVTILWRMYRATGDGATLRVIALAMVTGGALGNLIDRLRWSEGVVDFIDAGIGIHRWPTFNVADMGVSVGAVLLAWVLWQEEEAGVSAAASAGPSSRDPGAPAQAVAERSA